MTTITDSMPTPEDLSDAFQNSEFGEAARSAFNGLKPTLALVLPALRRVNWRVVALSLAAGTAAYLVRSMMVDQRRKNHLLKHPVRPTDLHRWEDEGGMIATSVPGSISVGARNTLAE